MCATKGLAGSWETEPMIGHDRIGQGSDVFGMASQQSPVHPYRMAYATLHIRQDVRPCDLKLCSRPMVLALPYIAALA